MAPVKLNYDARAFRDHYVNAEPFPHVVLDDLFDSEVLEAVLREFPAPGETQWMRFDNPLEKKLGYFHADFNVHPKLKLDRRLNMLIYLNKDWREDYGGHLELWNRGGKECRKRILPIFNRTVVFSTTDTSFHGHPLPLTAPPGITRKSVSLYYYTAGRPAEERSTPHDTLFI